MSSMGEQSDNLSYREDARLFEKKERKRKKRKSYTDSLTDKVSCMLNVLWYEVSFQKKSIKNIQMRISYYPK